MGLRREALFPRREVRDGRVCEGMLDERIPHTSERPPRSRLGVSTHPLALVVAR